jgi:hypothetical protein
MVRTVIKWTFWGAIALLLVFWLLGGGVQKIITTGRSFSQHSVSLPNLFSSNIFYTFHLPFAPTVYPQLPLPNESENGVVNPTGTYQPYQPVDTSHDASQSPYQGEIVLAQGAAIAQSATGQYIEVSAAPGAGPVNISGWTLQSALSGKLATIPQAASPFLMGKVNSVGNVVLQNGALAYVVTGPSPIGVSFSENMCTGYLGTLQPFVPALSLMCPAPLSEIPDTPENETRLGSSCFNYLKNLPPCTFPSSLPSGLSSACIQAIQTKLSYNGCIAAHQANGSQSIWRLYLAQGKALWGVPHDVIRLLDEQGRVVSVLNY